MKSGFPPSSRYFPIEVSQYQASAGERTVAFLRRRFVPAASRFFTLVQFTVKEGDRLDNVTATYLGDPEQFWRLCDANNALKPDDLTNTVGRTLRITLPEGVSGAALA